MAFVGRIIFSQSRTQPFPHREGEASNERYQELTVLWSSITPNRSWEPVATFTSPTSVFSGSWQVKILAYNLYGQKEATSAMKYHEILQLV